MLNEQQFEVRCIGWRQVILQNSLPPQLLSGELPVTSPNTVPEATA